MAQRSARRGVTPPLVNPRATGRSGCDASAVSDSSDLAPDVAPVDVRFATAADWRAWRDLRLRALADSPDAFGSTYERELAFGEDDWRARAAGAAQDGPLRPGDPGPAVLALAGEEPIGLGAGYCDLPGWLHVVAMWTAPAWRGRHVGERVVRLLAGWAAERGLRLHLDVETTNVAARRLYERCGFIATGQTRPLREGSERSAERMVLGV
jgi:ribosomal protein S18 acetylase RimI-like enzyme